MKKDIRYGVKIINGIKEVDYEKWVDLSNLSKWENGKNKGSINWSNSVGCTVEFKYKDIQDTFKIAKNENGKQHIKLNYDKNIYTINTQNFIKCKLGSILGKITSEFKIAIGYHFKDDKRDLIIIDRKIEKHKNGDNYKRYKYKCNKCNNEEWILESSLLSQKYGCNVCCLSPKKALLGVNTIWDKARWMCDLGVSEEDAKKYTPKSHKNIEVNCPNCKHSSIKKVSDIYGNKSIGCVCGDGFSYPEKFVFMLLKSLNVRFISQLSKTTLNWCGKYRYDFYIPSLNCIIETHGNQHYDDNGFKSVQGRTLKEEQENDKNKRILALTNDIDVNHYIELDCRKSNLEWIKNSILDSELSRLFDLSKVDWLNCEYYALGNLVKEVSEYWNSKKEYETTTDLAKVFKLSRHTIVNYLKKGSILSWCNYNL